MALVCVSDYEKKAAEILPKSPWDYYKSGAGDQITLELNKSAYNRWINYHNLNLFDWLWNSNWNDANVFVLFCIQRIRIRPRVLIDVSKRSTKCNVLGIDLDTPICIAPTAMQRMAHPDGEVASAKGEQSPLLNQT